MVNLLELYLLTNTFWPFLDSVSKQELLVVSVPFANENDSGYISKNFADLKFSQEEYSTPQSRVFGKIFENLKKAYPFFYFYKTKKSVSYLIPQKSSNSVYSF